MSCPNLERDDNGLFIDQFTLEAIPVKRLVRLVINGHKFCYDALSLVEHINRSRSLPKNNVYDTLPPVLDINTRIPLTEHQITQAYTVLRDSYPHRYLVVLPADDESIVFHITDQTYSSVAAAIAGGEYLYPGGAFEIYATPLLDDPALFRTMYPYGVLGELPLYSHRAL